MVVTSIADHYVFQGKNDERHRRHRVVQKACYILELQLVLAKIQLSILLRLNLRRTMKSENLFIFFNVKDIKEDQLVI